jgi:hypothetical protein
MDVPKALAAALALNRIAFGLGYLLRPEQGARAGSAEPPASPAPG